MTPVVSLLTVFHMTLVLAPTLVMATLAARKSRANISPYSTAVAALVDRFSMENIFIVPPLPIDIVPE